MERMFRSDRTDRSKRTTSRSGLKYSGRSERKRTFPFDFSPKFPDILAQWKAPRDITNHLQTDGLCKNRAIRVPSVKFSCGMRLETRIFVNGTHVSVGPDRPVKEDHLQKWSQIFRSERTERDLSIWLQSKLSGYFGSMESTQGYHKSLANWWTMQEPGNSRAKCQILLWNATGNENFCKWNARFGRTGPTGQRGPPPEVVPNIPVGANRKGPFHMTSVQNFRIFWLNGKHPGISQITCKPMDYARTGQFACQVSNSLVECDWKREFL